MRHRLFTLPTRRLVPVVVAALLSTGVTLSQSPVAAADPVGNVGRRVAETGERVADRRRRAAALRSHRADL